MMHASIKVPKAMRSQGEKLGPSCGAEMRVSMKEAPQSAERQASCHRYLACMAFAYAGLIAN